MKGLSKGRYDKTFAGEDALLVFTPIVGTSYTYFIE